VHLNALPEHVLPIEARLHLPEDRGAPRDPRRLPKGQDPTKHYSRAPIRWGSHAILDLRASLRDSASNRTQVCQILDSRGHLTLDGV
jgi:hypothetical protein